MVIKHLFHSHYQIMKQLVIFGISFLLLGSATGCKTPVDAPIDPLTFSFQLLNEQKQEATVFPQGQNIIFYFEARNNTDQEIALQNPIFNPEHFLELYSGIGENAQSVGKPYKYIFCTYNGFYFVPAHSILVFEMPWVASLQHPVVGPFCGNATNAYLPRGHYSTSFAPTITWHFGAEPSKTIVSPALVREFDVK